MVGEKEHDCRTVVNGCVGWVVDLPEREARNALEEVNRVYRPIFKEQIQDKENHRGA